MSHREASCSCGKLQVAVEGDPVRVSICHCLACQRRTGSVFGVQARFPAQGFKVLRGEASEYVRTGDSGTQATFRFCPACGATVYYTNSTSPDEVAVPVGAFADPAFPAPWVAVYEARRHPWTVLQDETRLEHYD